MNRDQKIIDTLTKIMLPLFGVLVGVTIGAGYGGDTLKTWLLSRYAWAVVWLVLVVPLSYFQVRVRGGKAWRDGVLLGLLGVFLFADTKLSPAWFDGFVIGLVIFLAVWLVQFVHSGNGKQKAA